MAVWDDPAVMSGLERQLDALDRAVAGGADLIGWKVGVGGPAAMERAGITAPLVGFLTSATVLPDGASVSVKGWTQPVLEPELAVHLARDVPGGADRRTVAGAVRALGPAIELADVDVPLEDLAAVVAGDIYHRHVVVGDPDPARAGGDVTGIRVRVTNRGRDVAGTDAPTEATGDLVALVGHVADWLHHAGRRLEAGQVVICGSTVPLVPLSAGDRLQYRCEPIGALLLHIDDEPASAQ